MVNANKQYYEHLSKYGKSIGKELVSKPEYEEPLFKDFVLDKHVLNQTIAEHMFRSGYYQSGEKFTQEVANSTSLPSESSLVTEEFKAKFKALNLIVSEMRDGNFSAAKSWAREHQEQLTGSDLLYALVKSDFIWILRQQIELHIEKFQARYQGGSPVDGEDHEMS